MAGYRRVIRKPPLRQQETRNEPAKKIQSDRSASLPVEAENERDARKFVMKGSPGFQQQVRTQPKKPIGEGHIVEVIEIGPDDRER
jgi:hypothetical protein